MDQLDTKLTEEGFRQLCSDITLYSKTEGFIRDGLSQLKKEVGDAGVEMEAFGRQKCDRDRLLYCWTLPAIHRVVPVVRPVFRAKTALEALNRRRQGNDAFKDKNYSKALFFYNQSIIFAPSNSVEEQIEMALALSNRSATLVHLKEFRTAIRDIQLSLQCGYPAKQRYKLYERLGYCQQQLGQYSKARTAYNVASDCLTGSDLLPDQIDQWRNNLNRNLSKLKEKEDRPSAENAAAKLPELLDGSHPQLSAASASVELASDPESGRHFKATKNILPGEVLFREKPYATCLLSDKFGSHCHHCFVRLIAPLGCTKCRGVAFCSTKCRTEATSTYHAFECCVLDVFIGSGMSLLSWLSVRMLTQRGGVSDFIKWRPTLESPSGSESTEPEAEAYRRVYNLVTLETLRTRREFFDRTVVAIFLLKCLRTCGFLPNSGMEDGVDLDEVEVWTGTLLLRHLQLVQFNAHEIQELVLSPATSLRHSKSHYIGIGIYPTVAYLNHSCLPDVSRCFVGTSLVLRSSRSIGCGETVSENYGPTFTHKNLADRNTSLRGRYWFQCRCRPCTSRWTLYDGMSCMAVALTRCGHCGGGVDTLPPQHTYGRCQICRKQMPMAPIEEHVTRLGALYHGGLQAVEDADVAKASRLLSTFIESLRRDVGDAAVKEMFLAQEALRLVHSVEGTRYAPTTRDLNPQSRDVLHE